MPTEHRPALYAITMDNRIRRSRHEILERAEARVTRLIALTAHDPRFLDAALEALTIKEVLSASQKLPPIIAQ